MIIFYRPVIPNTVEVSWYHYKKTILFRGKGRERMTILIFLNNNNTILRIIIIIKYKI